MGKAKHLYGFIMLPSPKWFSGLFQHKYLAYYNAPYFENQILDNLKTRSSLLTITTKFGDNLNY